MTALTARIVKLEQLRAEVSRVLHRLYREVAQAQLAELPLPIETNRNPTW